MFEVAKEMAYACGKPCLMLTAVDNGDLVSNGVQPSTAYGPVRLASPRIRISITYIYILLPCPRRKVCHPLHLVAIPDMAGGRETVGEQMTGQLRSS